MDELIKMVSQKAGISEDQARTAATTVVGFLKQRLPEPIAGQLEQYVGGGGGAAAGVGGMAEKIHGMFGGKE